jgi:hypothetical protein
MEMLIKAAWLSLALIHRGTLFLALVIAALYAMLGPGARR